MKPARKPGAAVGSTTSCPDRRPGWNARQPPYVGGPHLEPAPRGRLRGTVYMPAECWWRGWTGHPLLLTIGTPPISGHLRGSAMRTLQDIRFSVATRIETYCMTKLSGLWNLVQ